MIMRRRRRNILAVASILSGLVLLDMLVNGALWKQVPVVNEMPVHNRFVDTSSNETVRVLCWVMTSPTNLRRLAVHVKNTWGDRCDLTLYFSSQDDPSFPAIGVNVSEGRSHLTSKSHHAFRYLFKHHFQEFDWFLKADDNTYVIVENLRRFLRDKNPMEPVYYGHHFSPSHVIEGGYMSGGAGYVLSRESLRRLAVQGGDADICKQDGGAEDVEIGRCLHNVGVVAGDSHDADGRSRFHCFKPISHIRGTYPRWYTGWDEKGGHSKGENSMSDYPISFHYIMPNEMYTFHYLLYHAKIDT